MKQEVDGRLKMEWSTRVNTPFLFKVGVGLRFFWACGINGLDQGFIFGFGIWIGLFVFWSVWFVRYKSPRTFIVHSEFPGTNLVIFPKYITKDLLCHLKIL